MVEVFCTRKLEDVELQKAFNNGIKITSQNFIQISPVLSMSILSNAFRELKDSDLTFLFTSKNAVKIAIDNFLREIPKSITDSWKFYCLSGATRQSLLEYFLEKQIIGSAKDANELTKKLIQYNSRKPIHFFCGNLRRNTLPDFMSNQDIPFKEWIIYETKKLVHPVNKSYQAYLFYSPSAVESFFSVNKIKKDIPCFSIGQTTADALRKRIENPLYISEEPETGQLLKMLSDYFKTEL